jgi:hypothetical protein
MLRLFYCPHPTEKSNQSCFSLLLLNYSKQLKLYLNESIGRLYKYCSKTNFKALEKGKKMSLLKFLVQNSAKETKDIELLKIFER